MRWTLFQSIMHELSETSPYFNEMCDATDCAGLTTLQKVHCSASISLWHGRIYDRVSRILLSVHH
jgi:hypothetical protein